MRAEKLSKKFGDTYIFKNIDLEFKQGKIYSIFGRNGVGKTTLLNVLNGTLASDGGEIYDAEKVILLEDNELPFEFMTANEFIDTTFTFKNQKIDLQEKEKLFKQLHFQPENKIIKDFSKGMKSKLCIIIALLSKPQVLLLDEPFSDIDVVSFGEITEILKHKKKEMQIIFSTHVSKIAFELSDDIVYLKENQALFFENNFRKTDELEDYILKKMSNLDEV
ncbi:MULTISPECIES: ABC transporter ATP-binding protein [Lactococcus]|uniref:ATP-binding cassette domain-containing protein n=1 Tax=Lactococcus TaxID=1357 RepID=UPI00203EA269|nr:MULTISPECIES: ABC transporter ATP-binding protein [Lactococcus]